MKRRSFISTGLGASTIGLTSGGCTMKKGNKDQASQSADSIKSLAGKTLEELREQYRADLFDEYLPFLEQHVIDHEYGGFMCNTRPDGTQVSTEKRAGYEGRGMWVFSFLYNNIAKEQKYLDVAEKSAALLMKNKPDGDNLWPSKYDREGNPEAPPSQSVNADLYIAEGFAEFSKASGDNNYLSLAKEVTMKCLRIFDHPDYGSFSVRRNSENEKTETQGIKMLDDWMLFIRCTKGIIESGADSDMEKLAARYVDTIMNKYYNPEFDLIVERLNSYYQLLKNDLGQLINFGNDFQALWHTMDEALRLKNKALFDTAATRLIRHIEVAWDDVYGGVFNTLRHVDKNEWSLSKSHYGQAETLVGLLKIIEHTGSERACNLFTQIFSYVEEKFPQRQYGYPLWILGSDRKVSFRENASRIGNFHQPRHLMLNLLALDRIIENGGKPSRIL